MASIFYPEHQFQMRVPAARFRLVSSSGANIEEGFTAGIDETGQYMTSLQLMAPIALEGATEEEWPSDSHIYQEGAYTRTNPIFSMRTKSRSRDHKGNPR